MKLSDAMEKGAKVVPQIQGSYLNVCELGYISCGCALGQAYVGLTGNMIGDRRVDVEGTFRINYPYLERFDYVKHPYDGQRCPKRQIIINKNNTTLKHVIVSLNDTYGWSTAQIVEWLRSEGL